MPDQESYRLIGLYNPIGRRPAFLTPVFGISPGANQFYVHRLNEDGRIEGFEEALIGRGELDIAYENGETFSIGDEPWWSFAFPDESDFIQGREGVFKVLIKPLVDDPRLIVSSMVRLEVLSFLDDRQRLPEALRTVFNILYERSPRSAAMWRNNGVLLKATRNALRMLVPCDRRTVDFDEAVSDTEMRIDGNTPNVLMAQSLYEYCARRSIELRRALERADFQAKSFNLNPVETVSKGGISQKIMDLADIQIQRDSNLSLIIKGKQVDLGDKFRDHVTNCMEIAISKYFNGKTSAIIVISRDANLFKADIQFHIGRGISLQSATEAAEPYMAFDSACEKLRRRLSRYKNRLRDHRGSKIKKRIIPSHHQVTEDDIVQYDENDSKNPIVIAETMTHIDTLTVSEAVMRMKQTNVPALLFRNHTNGGLNLIYLCADGNIAWIDPGAMAKTG